MNINIKIISGVEGKSLYINDRRVSGSKPWGGGKLLHEFDISLKEFQRSLPKLEIQALEE